MQQAPTTNAPTAEGQTPSVLNTPVAVPVPEPHPIQLIVVDAPADDPFWDSIAAQVEQQYGSYKKSDNQVLEASVGDAIMLALVQSLTSAGCTDRPVGCKPPNSR